MNNLEDLREMFTCVGRKCNICYLEYDFQPTEHFLSIIETLGIKNNINIFNGRLTSVNKIEIADFVIYMRGDIIFFEKNRFNEIKQIDVTGWVREYKLKKMLSEN